MREQYGYEMAILEGYRSPGGGICCRLAAM
jgi:hypothetical protein